MSAYVPDRVKDLRNVVRRDCLLCGHSFDAYVDETTRFCSGVCMRHHADMNRKKQKSGEGIR